MRILCLFTIFSLLVGCGANPAGPVIDTTTFKRGLLMSTDSGFSYADCNQTDWRPLELEDERIAAQYRRIAGTDLSVILYVEGWFSAPDRLGRLQMLGGDLLTCQAPLPGIQLRAGGTDPVWYADITEAGGRITMTDPLRSWRLIKASVRTPGVWSWKSLGASDSVRLRIERKACVDASGAWYGLSALLSRGVNNYSGCARYGDLERLSLASKYYSKDPGLTRQVGLSLAPDFGLRLSLIAPDGRREVYAGRWRLLGTTELLIHLQRSGSVAPRDLIFRREGKQLRLMNQDPLLGQHLQLLAGPVTLLDALQRSGVLP